MEDKTVFEQLFEMKKPELISKLKSILEDTVPEGILDMSTRVHKEINDDKPTLISLSFYSKVQITSDGIYLRYEHGPGKWLVKFNSHFVL